MCVALLAIRSYYLLENPFSLLFVWNSFFFSGHFYYLFFFLFLYSPSDSSSNCGFSYYEIAKLKSTKTLPGREREHFASAVVIHK